MTADLKTVVGRTFVRIPLLTMPADRPDGGYRVNQPAIAFKDSGSDAASRWLDFVSTLDPEEREKRMFKPPV